MKLPRRQFLHLAAGAAALPLSRVARAQTYPTKPITMIVPFAAGGPTDVIGRILAQHMRASTGQTVIVENVAGAAGNLGVGRVARAAPDGYTINISFVGGQAGQAWSVTTMHAPFAQEVKCKVASSSPLYS